MVRLDSVNNHKSGASSVRRNKNKSPSYLESFLAQVPLGAGSEEVHAEPVESHLRPVGGEENLPGRLLLLVLPLHDGDVPLGLIPPAAQLVVLVVLHVLGLEVGKDEGSTRSIRKVEVLARPS